jgi:hypothetical protein
MRFSLAEVINAAERLARGGSAQQLEADQQRAMREDSLTNLVRDAATETIAAIFRRFRSRKP